MDIAYNDVLKRLKEERRRLSFTQKEMSQCIRMNQSNYSKVELGLRRLRFYELKYLCESEIDVHYVYTAQKASGSYKELLDECSYAELICFLSVIYSIVVLQARREPVGKWHNLQERLKYVPLIEENQKPYNIFMRIRQSVDCQQQRMAEMLGVDVKKQRDLENGRSLPDSELLCRIYHLFHIPPSAIIKDKKGIISELSILLDGMDVEDRQRMLDIITMLRNMN